MQPPLSKKPDAVSGAKRGKGATAGSCCPFCNDGRLVVQVPSGDVNLLKIAEREEEEQRTIEAKIRASLMLEKVGASTAAVAVRSDTDETGSTCSANEFGASLQKHSSLHKGSGDTKLSCASRGSGDECLVAPLLVSVEERGKLEEEMRLQHRHPLARRMQQEAEQARIARAAAAAALGQNSASSRLTRRLRSRLGSRHRDWHQIVESFESEEEYQTLDDLVVIEAAILLSMEEAARREGRVEEQANFNGDRTVEYQINDGSIAQQMNSEFSLLQSVLSRRSTHSEDENVAGNEDEEHSLSSERAAASLSAPIISRRRGGGRRMRLGRSVARDTAGLLMRGVSEEEQLAMAIVLSLRESEEQVQQQQRQQEGESALNVGVDFVFPIGNAAGAGTSEE